MIHKNWSIGVDIGGTHITCAAVKIGAGELLQETLSRETYDHAAPAGVILQAWAKALNNTLSKIEAERLAGIGFAIPGPFDYRNGVSKMTHKFVHLYDIHIAAALNPMLTHQPDLPMRFINDATAFAIGEAWLGEGKGFRKVVLITLGTGFGSAFIEDGVPVVARGDVPKEGCLWHLPFGESIADDYFSTGWFVRAYERQTGVKTTGVKALMDKAGSEEIARGLFRQFGHNLAECLAPWLRAFEADALIIGGNIAHALPLFEAELQEGLQNAGVSPRVAPSKLLEHAALAGSARLLDDDFWIKVSAQLPAI